MHHAIRALLIVAGAVGVPIGLLHQLLERLGVTFAEEIARALPTKHGARGIAPRRAVVALISRQEVEKHRRLAELPIAAATTAAENAAEQLLGLLAIEEVLLVRRAFIRVAG